mgnify:CR=1 FL=1|tara:strand:+ start:4081 stop:4821 length:741 start_codon:yes stop_codon:yes gene_type:complete
MKYIMLLTLLVSCTSTEEEFQNFKRRNIGEYFNGSGVVQYFLPDLPVWADTVSSLECQRENSVRFFNFEKLQSSFGLSYQQMVQFQLAFNISKQAEAGANPLTLSSEERLFYSVSELIQADIVPFRIPDFKIIHLVVLDTYLAADTTQAAKKLISSASFEAGFPVFVSLCYSDKTVRKFVERLDFNGKFEVLPLSVFSPFAGDTKKLASPSLDLEAFFGNDKKIKVFHPKGVSIPDLVGAKTKIPY